MTHTLLYQVKENKMTHSFTYRILSTINIAILK